MITTCSIKEVIGVAVLATDTGRLRELDHARTYLTRNKCSALAVYM